MKKIIVVLLSLLLLAGCSSNHYSNLSNGDEVIYERPDGSLYTAEDLYQYEKKLGISESLASGLIAKIAELEGIDVEAIKKEAEEYIETVVEQGGESLITYYYGSKENYVIQATQGEAKSELLKKVMSEDFDSYVEKYKPFKASIVYFDNEEAPTAALKDINENSNTFAYACSNNGYTSEVTETIYKASDTELPNEVRTWIESNNVGVSPVIKVAIVTTGSDGNTNTEDRYYLVNLVSKDVNEFKDEFLDSILGEVDENVIIYDLLKKHTVSIYDQDVYEELTKKYEVLK